MRVQKLSISLPQQQCEFIEAYQDQHQCKNRSEVIKKALLLLQQQQLAASYAEANQEIDDALDHTAGDGLDNDETW